MKKKEIEKKVLNLSKEQYLEFMVSCAEQSLSFAKLILKDYKNTELAKRQQKLKKEKV